MMVNNNKKFIALWMLMFATSFEYLMGMRDAAPEGRTVAEPSRLQATGANARNFLGQTGIPNLKIIDTFTGSKDINVPANKNSMTSRDSMNSNNNEGIQMGDLSNNQNNGAGAAGRLATGALELGSSAVKGAQDAAGGLATGALELGSSAVKGVQNAAGYVGKKLGLVSGKPLIYQNPDQNTIDELMKNFTQKSDRQFGSIESNQITYGLNDKITSERALYKNNNGDTLIKLTGDDNKVTFIYTPSIRTESQQQKAAQTNTVESTSVTLTDKSTGVES